MDVRRANSADRDSLIKLGRETSRETYTGLITPHDLEIFLDAQYLVEKVQKEFLDEACEYYVGELNGQLIGFAKLLKASPRESLVHRPSLMLDKIYLKKTSIGSGYGLKLLTFLEGVAKRKNYKSLWLWVNCDNSVAVRFYEKAGFLIREKTPYPTNGLPYEREYPNFVMEKRML